MSALRFSQSWRIRMDPSPTDLSLALAAERLASIPWASMTGWEASMADGVQGGCQHQGDFYAAFVWK